MSGSSNAHNLLLEEAIVACVCACVHVHVYGVYVNVPVNYLFSGVYLPCFLRRGLTGLNSQDN